MNINDKKEQLKKLRKQEQKMYREIERLENDIAAESSKTILERIKECKFEISYQGNAKIHIKDASPLWCDIMNGGKGYCHFEFPLSSNYQIRVDDSDINLQMTVVDNADFQDRICKTIRFLKDNGVPRENITFECEDDVKSLKHRLSCKERDLTNCIESINEVFQ